MAIRKAKEFICQNGDSIAFFPYTYFCSSPINGLLGDFPDNGTIMAMNWVN